MSIIVTHYRLVVTYNFIPILCVYYKKYDLLKRNVNNRFFIDNASSLLSFNDFYDSTIVKSLMLLVGLRPKTLDLQFYLRLMIDQQKGFHRLGEKKTKVKNRLCRWENSINLVKSFLRTFTIAYPTFHARCVFKVHFCSNLNCDIQIHIYTKLCHDRKNSNYYLYEDVPFYPERNLKLSISLIHDVQNIPTKSTHQDYYEI